MKKLMKKKNNKGFSLVELIVVVLILGILAVALAPQVMKWVDKAKENSDKNQMKDIESAVNIAISEAQSEGWTIGSSDVTFQLKSGGMDSIDATLKARVEEVLKITDAASYPKTSDGKNYYKVTIKAASYQVKVEKGEAVPATPGA